MAKIMKDGKPSTSFSRQDREWVKAMGGGGGSSVEVEALTVTENGTYTAQEGKAYSPVTVNVASDFSTAEVQVTLGQGVTLVSIAGAMTRTVEGQTSAVADNRLDSSGTISVILCGETGTSLLLEIEPSNATVVTTGDINNYYSEDDEVEVLGPGTITITAGS